MARSATARRVPPGTAERGRTQDDEDAKLLAIRELSRASMATAGSVLLLQRWLFIVACLRLLSGERAIPRREGGQGGRGRESRERSRAKTAESARGTRSRLARRPVTSARPQST